MNAQLSRRAFVKAGGALFVMAVAPFEALAAAGAAGDTKRVLDPSAVDAFFALHQDGSVTVYCGKVDLGTGLRIAIPQMAAEELGLSLDRICLLYTSPSPRD